MPLFIGDYLGDTMHLSTTEHGAYLLLIMHYWRTGKPLPDGDEALSRIARLPREQWDSMAPVIRAFFDAAQADGCAVLTHSRVEEELTDAVTKYESRKAGGQRAAAARKGTKSSTPDATDHNSGSSTTVQPSQPQPQPHSSSKEEDKKRAGARENGAPRSQGEPMADPHPSWNGKFAAVETQMGYGTAHLWLADSMLLENDDGTHVISVPKRIQADKLKAVFWLQLDRALGEGKYSVEHHPPKT